MSTRRRRDYREDAAVAAAIAAVAVATSEALSEADTWAAVTAVAAAREAKEAIVILTVIFNHTIIFSTQPRPQAMWFVHFFADGLFILAGNGFWRGMVLAGLCSFLAGWFLVGFVWFQFGGRQ